MIRTVAILLLATALLWGTQKNSEVNATVAAAEASAAKAFRTSLDEADRQLKEDKSVWKKALSAYTEAHFINNRLAGLDLQNGETVTGVKAKRKLEKERSRLHAALKKIGPSLVKAVEYYVRPTSEQLSVRDPMYKRYERDAGALDTLRTVLQQKQKALSELIKLEQNPAAYQKELKRVTFTIDTLTRVQQRLRHLADARLTRVNELDKKYADLKEELDQSNIWQKSYTAYLTYLDVQKELAGLQAKIKKIDASRHPKAHSEERDALAAKQKILSDQLSLLQSHSASPFADLLKPEEIESPPEISNPLDIFSGFSYNKKVREQLTEYTRRGEELKTYLELLLKSRQVLLQLAAIDDSEPYANRIKKLDAKIEKYQTAYNTLKDTANVYAKRVEEIELKINKAVREQLSKLANIGGIIVFLLLFFFIMKQIAKKYISDNERFYMANKIITFVNVTLILLVLLFNYIENVNYLITVLGFASAGIAIAMKDWFMSMLGWLVIVFGGSIHVGDRIRADKDGKKYVGDVLDISMLRITILEDITLTSYTHNRRAGRVIFIPNNYIFTEMIANYTHVSLKTVWDGIDITITFDSNHKKAAQIAKEITRKFAKGYTDITRQQLNKLRSRYNLKNTNVDPRIYSFVEENGIRISAWYLTNAYATLTLRSTISMEIIDSFGKEDDITIAYPTQRLRLQNEPLPQPTVDGDDGAPV